MAGFRDSFIYSTNPLTGLLPESRLMQITRRKLILPVYHLVSDDDVPHVKHLYRIKTVQDFHRDLEFLLKHFEPIDYHTLVRIILEGEEPQKPSFFLSFDDGLQPFYSVVAPILNQYGVPAMNFLNSAFIGNRDLFFRYKVSLLIDRLQSLEATDLSLIQNLIDVEYHDVQTLSKYLLNIDYSSRFVLDKIATLLDLDFGSFLVQQQPYLTQSEIRHLISQGFTFGAHSVDHPMFAHLSLEEQILQTQHSVNHITRIFNLDYRAFAFPYTDFGISRDFFDRLYQPPLNLQLTFGSAGMKDDIYPNHLQRIPMEMKTLPASKIIKSEQLYFFLKTILGKNQIGRS